MTNPIETLAHDIAQCERCPLHQTRHNTVPGSGDPNADIMFIGEGPGQQEDQQGKPFIGPSGKMFDQILQATGIDRRRVFVTNVLKCRAPENRNPAPDEVAACRPWLESQIEAVKPRLVVTMGNPATQWFQPGTKISDVRGKIMLHKDGYLILPTFHPAAILRRPTLEDSIRQDFSLINPWLNMATPPPETPPGPIPEGCVPGILQTLLRLIKDLEQTYQDPRQQRQALITLALFTRAAERALAAAPTGEYADWCRHLLAQCMAAGRETGHRIPQICRNCNASYYPSGDPNERSRQCQTCHTPPADPTAQR